MHGKKADPIYDYVIGIDASLTSTGVYWLSLHQGREDRGYSIQSGSKDGSDLFRVKNVIRHILQDIDNSKSHIAMVAIEDYGPIGRTSGKIAQRAEIVGTIKWYLHEEYGIPLVTVVPTSLKSYAVGKGNASKDDMLDACKKFSIKVGNHDEADAFHLARLARGLVHNQRIGVAYQLFKP